MLGSVKSEAKARASRLNGANRSKKTRPAIAPNPAKEAFGKGWSYDAYL